MFKISEVNFTRGNVRLEVIVAIVAVLFFFTGIYFNPPHKKDAFGWIMDPDGNKIELGEPVDEEFTKLYEGKTIS